MRPTLATLFIALFSIGCGLNKGNKNPLAPELSPEATDGTHVDLANLPPLQPRTMQEVVNDVASGFVAENVGNLDVSEAMIAIDENFPTAHGSLNKWEYLREPYLTSGYSQDSTKDDRLVEGADCDQIFHNASFFPTMRENLDWFGLERVRAAIRYGVKSIDTEDLSQKEIASPAYGSVAYETKSKPENIEILRTFTVGKSGDRILVTIAEVATNQDDSAVHMNSSRNCAMLFDPSERLVDRSCSRGRYTSITGYKVARDERHTTEVFVDNQYSRKDLGWLFSSFGNFSWQLSTIQISQFQAEFEDDFRNLTDGDKRYNEFIFLPYGYVKGRLNFQFIPGLPNKPLCTVSNLEVDGKK